MPAGLVRQCHRQAVLRNAGVGNVRFDRKKRRAMRGLGLVTTFLLSWGLCTRVTADNLDAETVAQLAAMRIATAKYLDIEKAKADGYSQGSDMIPHMGYHFGNPNIPGFDPLRPRILLYVKHQNQWHLVGAEYTIPWEQRPPTPPFKGASWGFHPANCHYQDGSEIASPAQDKCPPRNPVTDAAFTRWHPDMATIHVWIWYPNPHGVFAEYNPWLTPFNRD